MSDKKIFEEYFCPICEKPAERGFLAGNPGQDLVTMTRPLEWFSGEPSAWQRITTLGEAVGEVTYMKGQYATGIRCKSCRKIVLDI